MFNDVFRFLSEFILRWPGMRYKRRRTFLILFLALTISVIGIYGNDSTDVENSNLQIKNAVTSAPPNSVNAMDALGRLAVRGRAPKSGYDRTKFMDDWREENNCDKRNIILQRDLSETSIDEEGCLVLSGLLHDPYTATEISFVRGSGTSNAVQIDHVVALSDAWQKGAQGFTYETRNNFASDSLNLLAVDGPANQDKSDNDAATWLPPSKIYRCAYIARQIAVKLKYNIWITRAEKDSMQRILNRCPQQVLPVET